MRTLLFFPLFAVLLGAAPAQRGAQAAKPAGPFKTTLTLAEMTGKQAVVVTSAGEFVIGLRPDLAPNHVGYFIKLAKEGAFNGTIFHRVIRLAIIQGGDPLSKDPAKAKLYGTGGLGVPGARVQRRARHARSGCRCAPAEPTGERRRAVLRLRHRSACARWQVHGVWPGG